MQDLSSFNNSGFDRGAGCLKEALWLVARQLLFLGNPWPLYGLKRWILRQFGAKLRGGFVVKSAVRIIFPWRLSCGESVWIGDDVLILNLAQVTVGSNVCISQRAFLCTGSHDWSDPAFRLITRPITIHDGAWICAGVFISPGVTIGRNCVVTAGSVVTGDLPAEMVCSGNPCVPVKRRGIRSGSDSSAQPVRDEAYVGET